VIGLALMPGKAESRPPGLRGTLISRPVMKQVNDPTRLVAAGAALLAKLRNDETLGLGVSVTDLSIR